MSYENAPATKMLSTHCAACGRPLLDAASVEAGMGPTCRARFACSLPLLDPDVRAQANKLVHECARYDVDPEVLVGAVVNLALLGCEKLATRIGERAGVVKVEVRGSDVLVDAPYRDQFIANRGRGRWDPGERLTRYHASNAVDDAVKAIGAAFPTHVVRYTDEDGVRFMTHAQLAEVLLLLAVFAVPEVHAEPSHSGTPARLRGRQAWGVCLPRGTSASPGQVVLVKPRSGAEFTKRLVKLDSRAAWGDVWATE